MKERLAALSQALRLPDVRKRILFVGLMFAVYGACAHVPLPGINHAGLANLFGGGGGGGGGPLGNLGDLLNAFSGGSLKRFSLLALGIMPYINASIIFQLLVMAIPSLEALQKEGEWGQRQIRKWTKYLTVALAFLQAAGMITLFKQAGPNVYTGTPLITVFNIVMMTAGTAFLMFLGDLITEKGIGQGVSLIIFAGIMTSMPSDLARTMQIWKTGTIGLPNLMLLAAIFLGSIYVIVLFQQAQRKIPVQYAKRVRGNRTYGGHTSYLPLRVNQAGVIPIIFAIAVAMFPATIAGMFQIESIKGFFTNVLHLSPEAVGSAVNALREWTMPGPQNHLASLFYFFLVIIFTYFYTAVTFNPEQIAENLQKSGGTIPGVRPGAKTRDYLDRILYRITLAGAVFLGVIAVLQYYVGTITGVHTFSLVGGTSLLIVVGVALDTMQQIEAQLLMRHYRGFLSA
ncbi:MAG TPA: preprotein translocase subunit SecY [Armatimonadota bacterium]|jgi:preprotein translocase subunit SecY